MSKLCVAWVINQLVSVFIILLQVFCENLKNIISQDYREEEEEEEVKERELRT